MHKTISHTTLGRNFLNPIRQIYKFNLAFCGESQSLSENLQCFFQLPGFKRLFAQR